MGGPAPDSRVAGQQQGRRLRDFISLVGQRVSRSGDRKGSLVVGPAAAALGPDGPVFRSKTLQKFLSVVCVRPAAEFLDLGPVIGSNITFLGERVGCKIHVENLYADLDDHAREATLDGFGEFLRGRFRLPSKSIDGILCWDVFDYLAPAAANVLAGELMRLLRPEGALLAFFGTVGPRDMCYTKYIIDDEEHLRYHTYAAGCARQRVWQNREIMRLFHRLHVFDSVLLKSGVREILFRNSAV